MKIKALSTLLASIMITGTAFANSEIPNYKPSTENQVGRNVDHNEGDTYVNPTSFKSLSLADKNLRSLGRFKDSIGEEVGHAIIYGNQLTNVNEFYNTKKIYGNLKMHDNPITHLRGFQSLEEIRGSFHIYNTRIKKENLDGLLNLKSVGGDFIMGESTFKKDHYVDLRGLQSLEEVSNDFQLNKVKIKSLTPLNRLTRVGNLLDLSQTEIKDLSGIQNLKYVGDANLSGNPLVDISGLHTLEVEGHILIDKTVLNNPNFRGLRSSAWLCQPENANKFHPNGVQQQDVCG